MKPIKNNNTKCPVCKNLINSDFIVINGGAMKYISKQSYSMLEPKDQGFLTISKHTIEPHELKSIDINKTNESNHGQFDLYFCNSECFRKYFNHIADKLNKETP